MLSGIAAVATFDRVTASRWMKRWCEVQRRIFGIEFSLEDRNGEYDAPPYLFVHLNQTSLSESFVQPTLVPIPYRLIVNVEFAMLPFLGWSTVAMGSRVIVRQWSSQARAGIDRAIADLERGESYLISVEGRRSPDGSLQPYKNGAAVMAIRSGATVIPFLTFGARERLPFGSWRVRPGPVHGVLCEAIGTAGMSWSDRHALTARLRAIAESETASFEAGRSVRA